MRSTSRLEAELRCAAHDSQGRHKLYRDLLHREHSLDPDPVFRVWMYHTK